MQIETCLHGDNLIHIGHAGSDAFVVDPGSAAPVLDWLRREHRTLTCILVTHGHADHTGGCAELRRECGCALVMPAGARRKGDRAVRGGDTLEAAGVAMEVLDVPGHTDHDVAYFSREAGVVCTGDTLFLCGCGRVSGERWEQMWSSLCRLRDLPPETNVLCGHDYTLENLDFALHLEPDHAALRRRRAACTAAARPGRAPAPSTVAEERATNPFLRCDTPELAAAVDMAGEPPVQVFTQIRRLKSSW